jgi:choice-of-anchor B domain-containing protein
MIFPIVAALSLATPPLVAFHDDDPKILDRQPPVPGTGYTAASNAPGLSALTAAASLGFPADNFTLQSWMTMSDLGFGGANGNDCWGYTSPSGREYALMLTTQGTAVVEVSNPTLPDLVGTISGPNSTWRDIKVYGSRAYAVSEGGSGIQVIDLSNVDAGVVTLENTVTGPGTSATHNIALDEVSGFLYRTGGGSEGLRIYSLANPSAPQYVGSWSQRYVHDAQVVTYTSGPFAGRELAYCCGGLNGGQTDTGLTIVDVTNKSNPVVLSQVSYPARAYSHQGWLSNDRTRFYLGDELDEGSTVSTTTTRVFDVSDPANATYIGAFDNGNAAIGHNMYERDGILFQANYTSGLRAFDLNQSLNSPPEVGFFDTAPNSSSASFNGLWSCFVGFPSGTIIGSDIESGLFVLRFGPPELAIALAQGEPETIDPSGGSVSVEITELIPGSLDPATPTLTYNIGGGATTVPLVANGGSSFTAAFPPIPCGTQVSWYLSASSQTGQTVNSPSSAPSSTYSSIVATSLTVARDDDMESTAGWIAGAPGDDATTGIWERGNPVGTAAQPEDDHSPVGAQCWFTGQGNPGGSIGSNDVDGGSTTLRTPILDMSSLNDPTVSYYRWYSNDQGASPNADVFVVEISNDGGSSWSLVESVGPSGAGTAGGWIQHTFSVSSILTPTAQMQMRFIASDLGSGSIVEAAVDDFEVSDVNCGDGIGTVYCDAENNSTGREATVLATGSAEAALNDLTLTVIDLPFLSSGYFIVSRNQGFVANPGGSQGNLCVGSGTGRYLGQVGNSGFVGSFSISVDTTAIPQPSMSVPALPGETWNFQCWYRDQNPGNTSNFSRGYSVTFQ